MSEEEIESLVNSDNEDDRRKVATNPNLTSKQIEQLYMKCGKCRIDIQSNIENSNTISEQQIRNLLAIGFRGIEQRFEKRILNKNHSSTLQEIKCFWDIGNKKVITALIKRMGDDRDFRHSIGFQFNELKYEYLKRIEEVQKA